MGKKPLKQKNMRQTTLLEQFSSSPQRASLQKSKTQQKKQVIVDNDSDSGSDESLIADIPFESDNADTEDDVVIMQSSPHRKRRTRISSGDPSEQSEAEAILSEESGSVRRSSKRIKRRRLNKSDESEDAATRSDNTHSMTSGSGGDEDENASTKAQLHRRRLIRKRSGTPKKTESQDDPEDLEDEVDKEHIIAARFRKRGKKSAFQENLERLKQRKLRQTERSSPGSEFEESESEHIPLQPFRGAKPTLDLSDSDEVDDNNEDDIDKFIVEDDGTVEQVELPVEFSMGTHQDLGHHFKTIFQFFVHIAVQPQGKRAEFMQEAMKNTQYFSVPLQVTRRKISGLRDSLVASSVWRPEFKNPLMKYPELEISMLEFAVAGCDACHLGGRLSSRIAYLRGQPYNQFGFESIEDDEEEEDGGDEDEEIDIEFGKKAEFHLGRFCARRCRVFHSMCHWEYTLYQAIRHEIDSLRSQRSGQGFVRVSHAHGKRPPRDLTNADKLMDWLDDRQIVEREWSNIRQLMKNAHELEYASKKGDED